MIACHVAQNKGCWLQQRAYVLVGCPSGGCLSGRPVTGSSFPCLPCVYLVGALRGDLRLWPTMSYVSDYSNVLSHCWPSLPAWSARLAASTYVSFAGAAQGSRLSTASMAAPIELLDRPLWLEKQAPRACANGQRYLRATAQFLSSWPSLFSALVGVYFLHEISPATYMVQYTDRKSVV